MKEIMSSKEILAMDLISKLTDEQALAVLLWINETFGVSDERLDPEIEALTPERKAELLAMMYEVEAKVKQEQAE